MHLTWSTDLKLEETVALTDGQKGKDYYDIQFVIKNFNNNWFWCYRWDEFGKLQNQLAFLDERVYVLGNQNKSYKKIVDLYFTFKDTTDQEILLYEKALTRNKLKGIFIGSSITAGTFLTIIIINSIKNAIQAK